MTRRSCMKIADHVEFFLFPEDCPESFLVDLIEKYGSVELGIGISSQTSSRKMIEAFQSITNGFLVFNAIYLDKQVIRLPEGSEKEFLEKSWKMPLRWLYPSATGFEEEDGSLPSRLGSLLKTHNIKAFLMSDGHGLILDHRVGNERVLPGGVLGKKIPSLIAI